MGESHRLYVMILALSYGYGFTIMFAYYEHYTIKDYDLWEGHWELLNGMPYAMSPSPTVSHQLIAGNILTQFNTAIRRQGNGCTPCYALMEVDWEVSHDTIVKPDILILCDEIDERVIKTPHIIFEVSSPSTAKRDELLKFQLYEKEGVAYYVLVYPENKLAKVYHWINGAYQKQGDYSTGKLTFDVKNCHVLLDFSAIWRK